MNILRTVTSMDIIKKVVRIKGRSLIIFHWKKPRAAKKVTKKLIVVGRVDLIHILFLRLNFSNQIH